MNRTLRLAGLALALVLLPLPAALAQKPKEIVWTHAFDLACRKLGENEFNKDTQRFGVEAFKDTNTGLGIYLSQEGSMAVAGGFEAVAGQVKDSKGPDWVTGLDLPARQFGMKDFTKDTTVHAMEIFRDPNVNQWLYITSKGQIASAPVRTKPSGGAQAPKWVHSVDLRVRSGGEKAWEKAKEYGFEVYHDPNTDNLIFISQTGAIAVTPRTAEVKAGPGAPAPKWLHGLDLACRKFDERDFTKDTRRYGIEVFHDQVTDMLILLAETGNLAVVPAAKNVTAPTPDVKTPAWRHGLNLKARRFGEKEFSEKTRTWGGEVFRDDNIGTTIYLCENGSFSARKD